MIIAKDFEGLVDKTTFYEFNGSLYDESVEGIVINTDKKLKIIGFIHSRTNISSTVGLEATKTIEAGYGISIGDDTKAGDDLISGGNIQAGYGIKVSGSISAALDLKANYSIKAGLFILCKKTISTSFNVSAGQAVWKIPTLSEREITTLAVARGTVVGVLVPIVE